MSETPPTTDLFSGLATIYDRYRPDYPQAYVNYLRDRLSLGAGAQVADVGAGTGIFTSLLLDQGWSVSAVEPNPDMRAALCERLARRDDSAGASATVLARPAEDTGLANASVDLVTVAQAFHWFEGAGFLSECRRILKPGGAVALVWNLKREDSPVVQETEELYSTYGETFRGFSEGNLAVTHQAFERFYADHGFDFRWFAHDQHMDWETFAGRSQSASYAPREGTEHYEAFRAGLRDIFDRYADGQTLLFPNSVSSYLGRVGQRRS